MSNRRQFGCIESTREHTVTPRNAHERTGVQGKYIIKPNKGHHKCPINARTSMHLTYAVVVNAVIFFVLVLRSLVNFGLLGYSFYIRLGYFCNLLSENTVFVAI